MTAGVLNRVGAAPCPQSAACAGLPLQRAPRHGSAERISRDAAAQLAGAALFVLGCWLASSAQSFAQTLLSEHRGELPARLELHAGSVEERMLLRLSLSEVEGQPEVLIGDDVLPWSVVRERAARGEVWITLEPGVPTPVVLRAGLAPASAAARLEAEPAASIDLELREGGSGGPAIAGVVAMVSRDGADPPRWHERGRPGLGAAVLVPPEGRKVLWPAGRSLTVAAYRHPLRAEVRRTVTPRAGRSLVLTLALGADRRPPLARLLIPRDAGAPESWIREHFEVDDAPPGAVVLPAEILSDPARAALALCAVPTGPVVVRPRGGAFGHPFGPADAASYRLADGRTLHCSGLKLDLQLVRRTAAGVGAQPGSVGVVIDLAVERAAEVTIHDGRLVLARADIDGEAQLRFDGSPGTRVIVFAEESVPSRGVFAPRARAAIALEVPSR